MRKKIYFILTLLSIILIISCNKDNPISSDYSTIHLFGSVVDSLGNPVDSVSFHYIPDLTSSLFYKSGFSRPCAVIMIRFSVPKRSYVNLSFYRWFTREFIATLVNDTLDEGMHEVEFDASKLTNGVYFYVIKVDTLVSEKRTVLINSLADLPNKIPLSRTNSSGLFSVPIGIFGIGLTFEETSEFGNIIDTVYISNTIQVVLCKAGYKTLVQSLTLDTTKSITQKFTLNK